MWDLSRAEHEWSWDLSWSEYERVWGHVEFEFVCTRVGVGSSRMQRGHRGANLARSSVESSADYYYYYYGFTCAVIIIMIPMISLLD